MQSGQTMWTGLTSLFSSTSSRDAARQRALLAEYRLLSSRLPFLKDHEGSPILPMAVDEDQKDTTEQKVEEEEVVKGSSAYATVKSIEIEDGVHMNTFIMDCDGCQDFSQPARQTIVLTHGFGAALGFWFRNLHALSGVKGLRVYAIDWLGMGRSARKQLPVRSVDHSDHQDVETVENYFVDSLEQWRLKCNIPAFTLVGHSLVF